MQERSELLKWLKPGLEEPVAQRAGALLDPVAAHLASRGPGRLRDESPVLFFDPEVPGAYRSDPIGKAGLKKERPGNSQAEGGTTAESREDLIWLPPHRLAAGLREIGLAPGDLLEDFRKRIEEWDPLLNSFIRLTLDPDVPVRAGCLSGAPIGVQDMIDVAGVPTTAGSSIVDDLPQKDATAWGLLAREGAALAGKLNTQEFAAGTTGENDWFGHMRNPWDTSRTAGGAAGGAGAAVAAGLVSAAIATDPGGSVRVPAALCGVVGLKPTFGTIDRSGSIPLTWTTETMGVLARTVEGAAAVTDTLLDGKARLRSGLGCLDAATTGDEREQVPLRVGVPLNWLDMGLDSEVDRAYQDALCELRMLGAEIIEIDLPSAADLAPVHRAIAFSEASSIHEELILGYGEKYGSTIRDRQEAGRGVLASEYLKACRIRGEFIRQFSQIWREVDVIALPTSPVPAAFLGTETISTGSRGQEAAHTVYTRYSAPMSTIGIPALSVPCGFTHGGLPVGLQLCGPPYSEPLLFSVAASYERATRWHLSHPVLKDARVDKESA